MALHIWPLLWALSCKGQHVCEDGICGVTMVQLDTAKTLRRTASSPYWYPSRGVDYNRTGQSHAESIFPLKNLSWKYEVPLLNFHQTPCIDDMKNVYTGSDNGTILSFTEHGLLRWKVQGPSKKCQNPFLFHEVLYTGCGDGSIVALSMKDGTLLWSKKICEALPSDTYSITATVDHLFVPCGAVVPYSSPGVALVNRKSGERLWKKDLLPALTVNLAPCMLSDSVVFSDVAGGIHRLKLADGSLMWYTAPFSRLSYTLGGIACNADGLVFNGFAINSLEHLPAEVPPHAQGGLSAFDVETGQRRWTTWTTAPVHSAPSVGWLYGHQREAVVFGMGDPPGSPTDSPKWYNGTLYAVDSHSGDVIWTFEPKAWYGSGAASSTVEQICAPDLFSGATFAKDGTVYVNWSAGGITYALRDVDQDGRCAKEDPEEVSSIDFASGATGPPALAEKMLVVLTCRGPRVVVA